jgi:transcriptional regulator with XRE-family HTH domain
MTIYLGCREKLRRIQKSLGIDEKELGVLLGLSPQEVAAYPRKRGDEPTLRALVDELYLVVVDEISPYRDRALTEVAAHARRGGSLLALMRLQLLYPRVAQEE